jgi:hypothetical protein
MYCRRSCGGDRSTHLRSSHSSSDHGSAGGDGDAHRLHDGYWRVRSNWVRYEARQTAEANFTTSGSVAMSALLLFGIPARRRRWKTLLSMLLFATIAGAVIGCGGATNAAKTPANPGTYTLTVTGTSGAIVQSTAVTVGVN